jgi:5-methylcytosine-specific restriction endonuclease McrA
MRAYKLAHLSDAFLVRRLAELVVRDRVVTAALLAHIGEVDARRLYAPAGYPSMHAYCVEALHLSENAAYKRIRAARAAREFPALFAAIAGGKLHLAAVCLLAPHLTSDNAQELVAAAEHRRKSEVEQMIADRFPTAAGLEAARAIPTLTPLPNAQLAPGRVGALALELHRELAPGRVETGAGEVAATPPAPRKFALHITIDQGTHDKLRRAQELLSHAVPSGDFAQVLDRALDVLIDRLEKRKFAAAPKARPTNTPIAPASQTRPRGRRTIPAHVRRSVWERDQGQCTFVGAGGRRCPARKLLEFDHIDPIARGGKTNVGRLRLRCRAHNQLEAERAFGAEFMRGKRAAARARVARNALLAFVPMKPAARPSSPNPGRPPRSRTACSRRCGRGGRGTSTESRQVGPGRLRPAVPPRAKTRQAARQPGSR